MNPSAPDDERTVIRPGAARPGRLGHILPNGTRLRDFEITGLIGEGGFGIVYLAYDRSLERRVALKEYMPSSMAARVTGRPTVAVKSERHRDAFDAGLRSFVNEARLLARFDHPSLVKVYRFWEEHGTAYMVMPYYEGPTLKAALAARAAPPDEATLRAWLRPLLDALEVMHEAHCYHRDIAPDNILLTQTGPLLLDFGAARRVIGDMTHALTVVLKPGYAPIEQYGEVAAMTQGAWTDFYALASVVHFAITGRVPPSSVERLLDDRLERLEHLAAGRYSARFLAAIDAALAVRPQDRPQTDAAFRALLDEPRSTLGLQGRAFGPVSRPVPLDDEVPRAHPRADQRDSGRQPGQASGGIAADDLVTLSARSPAAAMPDAAEKVGAPHAVGIAPGRRPAALVGLLGGAIALIAAVTYVLHGVDEPAPSTRDASTATAVPTAPAPAAMPTTAPAPTTPAAAVDSAPLPTAAAPARAAASSSPALALPPVREATEDSAAMPFATTPSATAPARASTADPGVAAAAPMTAPLAPSIDAPETPPPSTRAARPARNAEAPARSPAAGRSTRVEGARPAPTADDAASSRCGDILQKASLEPLSAAEIAYLKRECR